jgi:protein-disulfide isomerase
MTPAGRSRTAVALDVATVLVLAVAAWLILRPQSALSGSFRQKRARAELVGRVAANWETLQSTAIPVGNASSPLSMIEFSDYECGYCKASAHSVDSALAGGLALGIIQLPRQAEGSGFRAAAIAVCLNKHPARRRIHLALFDLVTKPPQVIDSTLAELVGSGWDEIVRCADGTDVGARLAAHRQLATLIEVPGTPLFATRHAIRLGAVSQRDLLSLAESR